MNLQPWVDRFNDRFAAEQGLSHPHLTVRGGCVDGQFGLFRFTTQFQTIARVVEPIEIRAYHAGLQQLAGDLDEGQNDALTLADELAFVVNFDRFTRAVHLLNYLGLEQPEARVFLPVHPRHVLSVQRDHGAYFEELLQVCAMIPRHVVITVTLHPVYDRQFSQLLERLRNYRDRGYATALKFDPLTGAEPLDKYCVEFLQRFTPDFIRLDYRFLAEHTRSLEQARRQTRMLSAIRRLDTQLVIDGIGHPHEIDHARELGADFVQSASLQSPRGDLSAAA